MAENLAQDIRDCEAKAKKLVADAKSEAARIIAAAHTEAEQTIKNTRQQCHREWRETVTKTEKEADAKAGVIAQNGEVTAKSFYEDNKNSADKVADWLVREVIETYGSCQND